MTLERAEVIEILQVEDPPAPKKKLSFMALSGRIMALLGVVGLLGSILLDPVMHLFDSNHPGGITIGTYQMFGVVIALMLLLAGALIIIEKR